MDEAASAQMEAPFRGVGHALNWAHHQEARDILDEPQFMKGGQEGREGPVDGDKFDRLAQASLIMKRGREVAGSDLWAVIRAYYLPAGAEKERLCEWLGVQVHTYLAKPILDPEWVTDMVRLWAGQGMTQKHTHWANILDEEPRTLRDRRTRWIEPVLEGWRDAGKAALGQDFKDRGLVGRQEKSW